MKKQKITVSIVDDHPMIINGLKNMLREYKHIVLTGTYNNGEELMAGLEILQPDVLLLDIQLPGRSGDELAPLILKNYPSIQILALTNFSSSLYIATMLRQGAAGYLLKTTQQDTLIRAIESVFNGEQFIEPSLKEKMNTAMPNKDKRIYSKLSLTIREKEILRMLAAGYDNQKIADKLFIGYNTVRNYRARIFEKLEVNTISELVNKALTLGLAE
jgi:two-component system secretion response regulator SsrB